MAGRDRKKDNVTGPAVVYEPTGNSCTLIVSNWCSFSKASPPACYRLGWLMTRASSSIASSEWPSTKSSTYGRAAAMPRARGA